MSKNIHNLNLPEENKILLSRIEKRVPFLSQKYVWYFDNIKTVRSENIEKAYAVNEDLISILSMNDQLVEDLKEKSANIRRQHQTDFTREAELHLTNQLEDTNIIRSTIEQKDKLIKAEVKLQALHNWKKYLKKRNKQTKREMTEKFDAIQRRIDDEAILDIAPMNEDIRLIKKYIDLRKNMIISRVVFTVIILAFVFVLLALGGVFIWGL